MTKKYKSLPSVDAKALGKEIIKKIKILCRVPDGGYSPKTGGRHLQPSLPRVGLW
jgi:hypothetical protein